MEPQLALLQVASGGSLPQPRRHPVGAEIERPLVVPADRRPRPEDLEEVLDRRAERLAPRRLDDRREHGRPALGRPRGRTFVKIKSHNLKIK